MRRLLPRLVALCIALCLVALPLVALRAGHMLHGPNDAAMLHDHDAHSREGDHSTPHDRALDTARCALACAGLPITLTAPPEPQMRAVERLLPPAGGWTNLVVPTRLERPPRPFSA